MVELQLDIRARSSEWNWVNSVAGVGGIQPPGAKSIIPLSSVCTILTLSTRSRAARSHPREINSWFPGTPASGETLDTAWPASTGTGLFIPTTYSPKNNIHLRAFVFISALVLSFILFYWLKVFLLFVSTTSDRIFSESGASTKTSSAGAAKTLLYTVNTSGAILKSSEQQILEFFTYGIPRYFFINSNY